MPIRSFLIPFCVALLLAGCASTPRAASEASGRNSSGPVSDQELAEASESTMFDFIRAYRPAWLQRGRPVSIVQGGGSSYPLQVYMDGTRLGDVETLRNIATRTIRSARYYGPSDAQVRFGPGHLNGAIELVSRR